MRNTVDILGIPVDNISLKEATKKIYQMLKTENVSLVCTPNPEIIMRANDDELLYQALQDAELVVPDGIGVVIASKILKGNTLKERVAGYDLVQNTMKYSRNQECKYYFFGSQPQVAKMAQKNMQAKYPNIKVVGARDGYFQVEEIPSIIEDINNSGANILLVALGSPKQELWIKEYANQLTNIKVAIGVGGSLDVMAGTVKRAPVLFQKLGLEWFYRLITQPTRAKRMLVLPLFLIKVCKLRIK